MVEIVLPPTPKIAVNSGHYVLPVPEIFVFSYLMPSLYCTCICSALEHFQSRWLNKTTTQSFMGGVAAAYMGGVAAAYMGGVVVQSIM